MLYYNLMVGSASQLVAYDAYCYTTMSHQNILLLGLKTPYPPTTKKKRVMVGSASQLATYDACKKRILATGYFHDNTLCHFTASMISGVVVTTGPRAPLPRSATSVCGLKLLVYEALSY